MGTTRNIIHFQDIQPADAPLVGQKGARLAELIREGLPVPPGFCLTTMAYQALLSHNGLSQIVASRDVSAIRQALLASELPRAITDDVAAAYKALSSGLEPGISVAVRSSATSEDLERASFAGQYDSFLNVIGLDQLLASIKACWAGLWSERALTYLHEHGLDDLTSRMGVIIQTQVYAQVAGVLFTLNPLTGREEEMMVESAWGLGEAVVSGRVNPDTFVVDIYQEKVVEREVARQPIMFTTAEAGGIQEVDLPAGQAEQASLTDEQLLELTRLGQQVQAIYGYPQDIEWALVDGQFFVLQTRPLTSFSFDPNMGQWTSGNEREVLPGFPSPLSVSLSLRHEYGEALTRVFRSLKMGESQPGTVWGRYFFGRPYWNLSEVKRFAALIPGFKERTFDATVGIDPIYKGDGQITHWTPRTIVRAIPILFALKKVYRECWQEAEVYRTRFLEEIEPELDAVDASALSDPDLGQWVKRVFQVHWDTNIVAIVVSAISTQAQDDFEPIMRQLNEGLPESDKIVEGDLITGLKGVRTAQPGLELWNLSRKGLENPAVADIVLHAEPVQMAHELQATTEGSAFWTQIAEFIVQHRFMSPADEDLSLPRWDEDLTFALSTLQAYARSDESVNPARHLDQQREIRDATEARAVAALSRGWRRLWPFTHREFRDQLETVRRYVWWREELRIIAARAFYHTRRFAKELGQRWSRQGFLESPEHIFLLYRQHVLDGLEGKLSKEEARRFITRYLTMKKCYRNFDPPTTIGRGIRLDTSSDPSSEQGNQILFKGVPCSSGRVEGRARIVPSLDEAHTLERGEILIAPYTNPAWTPLFNLVAAIVIEEGGLLSHGAVVAREYGIPAVVRVEGALQHFHTGQYLRVDGTAGTVEILPEPTPPPPNPLAILGLEKLVMASK